MLRATLTCPFSDSVVSFQHLCNSAVGLFVLIPETPFMVGPDRPSDLKTTFRAEKL